MQGQQSTFHSCHTHTQHTCQHSPRTPAPCSRLTGLSSYTCAYAVRSEDHTGQSIGTDTEYLSQKSKVHRHTNNCLTIWLFPYLSSVGKSSVERSPNVFQTPTEIPLKIENKMTLRVSAETATLSGGMRRRKRDSAERNRLIAVLVRRKREGREDSNWHT